MPHSESADYGRLEKVVISLLAEGRPLTAAQLEQRVRDAQRRYSIQAIYHVLRKLRRQGIVIRVETRFSLSLTWALDLVDLARRIEQRVLSSAPATETVPETGETLCWRFSSITALDATHPHTDSSHLQFLSAPLVLLRTPGITYQVL
jgi:hypothetical protein